MKIGILQCGHTPDAIRPVLGGYGQLYPAMLDGHGFTFETFSVVDMAFPDDMHQADGWLVSGSKHGAYEDHAFIPPLMDFIRAAYAADVPLVGVCFGHQIIAKALGGDVVKFDGGWCIGRQSYDFGGETLALNAWHQDQVVTLPPDAEVVASNDFCKNAALVYGKKAFSVQPHPEFQSNFIAGLATHVGDGKLPPDQLAEARAKLPLPNDNTRMAAMIARFFKERVAA